MDLMILSYTPMFRRELMDAFHQVYSGGHISQAKEDLIHYGDYLDDISGTPGFAGYVAFMDKELVGFVLGYRLRWFTEAEYVLSQIAVLPAYTEQGIGRELIDFLRQDQKKKGTSHLSVTISENSSAYNFFVKIGLVIKSDLKTLYGDL
jgi:ribosomal protein S18 acetylase RimI-like enzyme